MTVGLRLGLICIFVLSAIGAVPGLSSEEPSRKEIDKRAAALREAFLDPEPGRTGILRYIQEQFASLRGGDLIPDYQAWEKLKKDGVLAARLDAGKRKFLEAWKKQLGVLRENAAHANAPYSIIPAQTVHGRFRDFLTKKKRSGNLAPMVERRADLLAREDMGRRFGPDWERDLMYRREFGRLKNRYLLTEDALSPAQPSKTEIWRFVDRQEAWLQRAVGENERRQIVEILKSARPTEIQLQRLVDFSEHNRSHRVDGTLTSITPDELEKLALDAVHFTYISGTTDFATVYTRPGEEGQFFVVRLQIPGESKPKYLDSGFDEEVYRQQFLRDPQARKELVLREELESAAGQAENMAHLLRAGRITNLKRLEHFFSNEAAKERNRLPHDAFPGGSANGIEADLHALVWDRLEEDPGFWEKREARAKELRKPELELVQIAPKRDPREANPFGKSRPKPGEKETAPFAVSKHLQTDLNTPIDNPDPPGSVSEQFRAKVNRPELRKTPIAFVVDPKPAKGSMLTKLEMPLEATPQAKEKSWIALHRMGAQVIDPEFGGFSIPTPDGFIPEYVEASNESMITRVDPSKERLVPGRDFEVYRGGQHGNGYFLRLTEEARKIHSDVQYSVYFRPDPDFRSPPSTGFLDLDRIKKAQASLREAGLTLIADDIDRRVASAEAAKTSLTDRDLIQSFVLRSRYEYGNQPVARSIPEGNPYFIFQKLIGADGGFHTTCEPASLLFRTYLREIQSPRMPEQRSSWVLGPGEYRILSTDFHADLVFKQEGLRATVLDATPNLLPGGSEERMKYYDYLLHDMEPTPETLRGVYLKQLSSDLDGLLSQLEPDAHGRVNVSHPDVMIYRIGRAIEEVFRLPEPWGEEGRRLARELTGRIPGFGGPVFDRLSLLTRLQEAAQAAYFTARSALAMVERNGPNALPGYSEASTAGDYFLRALELVLDAPNFDDPSAYVETIQSRRKQLELASAELERIRIEKEAARLAPKPGFLKSCAARLKSAWAGYFQ